MHLTIINITNQYDIELKERDKIKDCICWSGYGW
jgi:hypothetical protein